MCALHADMADDELHVASYVQSSDPGAVGAGMLWIDTTDTANPVLKMRNSGDSGWDIVADRDPASQIPHTNKGSGDFLLVCVTGVAVSVDSGDTIRISVFDLLRSMQGGAASPTYTFYIKKSGGSYGSGDSDPTAEYVTYTDSDAGLNVVVIKVNDGSNDSEEVTCQITVTDTT